ncbi:MAG: Unknown protein [uncultured Thiotrichaceae bacterium]|uniref:Uncharacterized protein n=1 Tax=uncultured Thiotrichaceae bacterium TaxID=298394 RepID=A0A6S6U8Z5_9GAMM|nr:MAG: Unknown protein [uncultured Thiotrichaceae bacterium]
MIPKYFVPFVALFLFACNGNQDTQPEALSLLAGNSGVSTNSNPPEIEPQESESLLVVTSQESNHRFESEHFSGSENCSSCHNGMTDESGEDLSIINDWRTTMMANSARDPFWKAMVASEVSRNPALSDTIEGKCARCHMPMAHVEASFMGEQISLLGDGFFSDKNPHFEKAAEGVSCTACHQIEETTEFGTEDATSGKFVIAENTGSNRNLYGPLANPMQGPMINNTGFTPVASDHMSKSALCGSCHDVTTPVVTVGGTVTGDSFPEQMVYSEWKNSAYAEAGTEQSCQSCHMPRANGSAKIATRPESVQAREYFSKHYFVGANTVMLDIMQDNADTLGISVNDFSKTIDRTREMLQSSATIAVEGLQQVDNQLSFDVRVSNKSGHKLPSGFPSRRAWLHVTVFDVDDNPVFESGAINAEGMISGVDADNNHSQYEMHHDVITSAEQVQVYESIMQNTEGKVNYTLLNASGYLKDNRLMPLGMDKGNIPEKIQVNGLAKSDDDFIAGEDLVSYRLAGISAGSYRIKVSLNYQTLAYAFANDLFRSETDDGFVSTFQSLYNKADFRYEEVITVETVSDS